MSSEARRIYDRERYLKDDKIKIRNTKYRLKNKPQMAEYQRKYYLKIKQNKRVEYILKNKGKILENKKIYYLKNKDKILTTIKEYQLNNKDKKLAYHKKWRNTEQGKLRIRIFHNKRRSFGFIPLNQPFPNSQAHHIDRERVIYIPKEIHRSIKHSVLVNRNMEAINKEAYKFL